MKWFKVYAEIIHDPKIRALAFEDRWHFVALMALTCDGTLDEPAELRDELVSVALGLHGIDLDKCKARLMRLRLIGDDWKPCKWDKRQDSSDPKAAARMRKYRASLKDEKTQEEQQPVTVTPRVTRNVTATLRTEERREKKELQTSNEVCRARAREPFQKLSKQAATPDVINPAAWALWVEYRASKRKPVTDHAARISWAALSALTFEQQAECISKSIANDWQGLFPDKVKPSATPAATTRARSLADDLTDRSWAS